MTGTNSSNDRLIQGSIWGLAFWSPWDSMGPQKWSPLGAMWSPKLEAHNPCYFQDFLSQWSDNVIKHINFVSTVSCFITTVNASNWISCWVVLSQNVIKCISKPWFLWTDLPTPDLAQTIRFMIWNHTILLQTIQFSDQTIQLSF